jgi:hypothetical protein
MSDNDNAKIRLTDDEKRQIDELNHAGEGVLAIASYLHVPPESVRKHLRKATQDRAGKLSGAVFMIGLALTLIPGSPLSFWPGIMFVLAATSLASGLGAGQLGGALQGAIWLAGIGLVFSVGFSLPLLFILIGLSSLFGFFVRPSGSQAEKKAAKKDDWREVREGLKQAGREISREFRKEFESHWEEEYEKRKNDERRSREADEADAADRPYEKPKRGAMRLSDDGELMDIVDDEEDEEYQDKRRR